MQRRHAAIEIVQIAHQRLDAEVVGIRQQVPAQALVVVPFMLLGELAAHEHQLLARVAVHEAEIGAQVGEALPAVARHTADQRALAVHDLVVAERQDEVLGESIDQSESQLVVVVATVNRLARDVVERVVHPAHVPLEAEAKSADRCRARHHRPRGRLFGKRGGGGKIAEHHLVHALEERGRFEILDAAVLVGYPLALAAAVVAVDHRGDGVDPEPVDAVALAPEGRVGQQEICDLAAAVVVDQRVPVHVPAFARVDVLVKRGAIEASEAMGIGGEMAGHPVDHHLDAELMRAIDEGAKLVGCAEAAVRGIEADRLVAPRPVERMLGDRHQLDVGEAHVAHVGQQVLGQLRIAEIAVGVAALPGAEMDLVDRDRFVGHLRVAARRMDVGQRPDHRGRVRRALGGERVRVGLLGQHLAVRAAHSELVERARVQAGHEELPDARAVAQAHRMTAMIPVVEVADQRDAARVGRPHREGDAVGIVDPPPVRAELLVGAMVRAFGQQIDVVVAEHQGEAIRVVDRPAAAGVGQGEAIGKPRVPRHRAGEEAGRVDLGEPRDLGAGADVDHAGALGMRLEAAHLEMAVDLVHAEDRERIAMDAVRDRVEGIEIEGHGLGAPVIRAVRPPTGIATQSGRWQVS